MSVDSRVNQAPGVSAPLALGLQGVTGGIPIPVSIPASFIQKVEGAGAEGLPTVGDPVLIGGVDGSGNTERVSVNIAGVLSNFNAVGNPEDAQSNTNIMGRLHDSAGVAGNLAILPFVYNGVSWDRTRGNIFGSFVQGDVAEAAAASGAPVRMGGWDGTDIYTFKTDTDGHLQLDVLTSSLPTGGSTSANQATANASLADIELNTDTGTAIDHKAVTVGAAATLISAASATRRTITISNAFTDLVAIGNSDVTLNTAAATDGFVLAAPVAANDGTGGTLTLSTTAAVYGIGASASSKVIIVTESD